MLKPEFTGQFKRDYRLAIKRGFNPKKLEEVIELRRKTPAFSHGDISRSYGRVGRTRTDTPVEIV